MPKAARRQTVTETVATKKHEAAFLWETQKINFLDTGSNMLEYLKDITKDWGWIVEASAVFGVFLLLFSKVRIWAWRTIKGVYRWLIFPFKAQEMRDSILSEIRGLKEDIKANTEISQQMAKDVDLLKETVGFNGGSGLMDIVGYIEGLHKSDFWHRSAPAFICDGEGRNLEVTYPYCSLMGVSTKADLTGLSWKGYTDTNKSTSYLSEFRDSAMRGESFRGKIEFFDINSTSQGSWIIVLNPISTIKAKTKRYIGMLYPSDDVSKGVAIKYGWPTNVPI
jgi:hypothetical protein